MDNQNFNNSGFGQNSQNNDQGQFYGGAGTQGQYSGYSGNNDPNANFNTNYNSNYGSGMNQGSPYNVPAGNGKAPKYSLWLTLAIVQMVLGCCCAGGIFTLVTGILTIVFDNNANDAYQIGDMTTYESKIKAAMITNIIGWVISVVIFVFAIGTGVLEGVSEAFSELGY
ncbi:MAG: CD225/dispanin family protein [Lachnospiraceae bacterium]|nr:CD225/dispanin family protein [Lachnospiraceae bacterium]